MTRTYVFSRTVTCRLPRGGWHDAPSGGGETISMIDKNQWGKRRAVAHPWSRPQVDGPHWPTLRLLFAIDKTHLQYRRKCLSSCAAATADA